MNIDFTPFFSSGYVHTELSQEVREEINELIWTADRKQKMRLSGVQTDNWMLPNARDLLSPIVSELVESYKVTHKELTDEYEQEVQKAIRPRYNFDSYTVDVPWVNITEKYMYNPPHNHQGVYSWVIFHDIPYSLEEERKDYRISMSNQPYPGCFYFIHPTHSGHTYIQNIEIDYRSNGHMILFPARIYHGVHPYYSTDKPRISLAGNVTL